MNITTLERLCKEYPNVKVKLVDGTKLDENYYRGFGSWRYDYAEPAIFFKDYSESKYMTFADLLRVLNKLTDGSKYEGYKGGLFSFEDAKQVHFEFSEECYSDLPLLTFIHPDDINAEIIDLCKWWSNMSIYLYGDLHRTIDLEPLVELSKERRITDKDVLIILGDFGGVWYSEEKDNEFLNRLASLVSYKHILFIDGNHENFDRLNKMTIVEMYGNPTHEVLKDKIYHLMRGYKYTIEDKTFFTMGGADSIDKYRRIANVDWWSDELPSNEEYERAFKTLDENDFTFDYIISHCTSSYILNDISAYMRDKNKLTNFFDSILSDLSYKRWYFAHYHLNRISETYNAECLYQRLVEI